MPTIKLTISGATPSAVSLVGLVRLDTDAAFNPTPSLPQSFTLSGDVWSITFSGPMAAYRYTYTITWPDGHSQTLVATLAMQDTATMLSVEDAVSLASGMIDVPSFAAASSSQQYAALKAATRDVNNGLRYQGRKFHAKQVHEFPRVLYEQFPIAGWIYDDWGAWWPFDEVLDTADWIADWDCQSKRAVIPAQVLLAVLYQADFILGLSAANQRREDIHGGVRQQANGGMSEQYDPHTPGARSGLCRAAWQLLRRYELQTGRMA